MAPKKSKSLRTTSQDEEASTARAPASGPTPSLARGATPSRAPSPPALDVIPAVEQPTSTSAADAIDLARTSADAPGSSAAERPVASTEAPVSGPTPPQKGDAGILYIRYNL